MTMNRILFIDDQENLLKGLRRLLRPMRNEWEMTFMSDSTAALAEIDKQCFDVVVTDMKMPKNDGVAVLRHTRKVCPFTVRIALSGQAEDEAIIESLVNAHQYLAKPCEAEQLRSRIAKACEVRELLGKHWLKELISSLESIPCLPENIKALDELLTKSSPSHDELAEQLLKDIGMSVKVLQAVNSAFFGSEQIVSSIHEAVKILGRDTLTTLLRQPGIFPLCEEPELQELIREVTSHSRSVANHSLQMATIEGEEDERRASAYTAGMLHELGRILLSATAPEKYNEVKTLVREESITLFESERRVYGATHSEVGAYLLALWGLPQEIVDAVAHYHEPQRASNADFDILTVLHAADALENALVSRDLYAPQLDLNTEYLKSIDRDIDIQKWHASAREEQKEL